MLLQRHRSAKQVTLCHSIPSRSSRSHHHHGAPPGPASAGAARPGPARRPPPGPPGGRPLRPGPPRAGRAGGLPPGGPRRPAEPRHQPQPVQLPLRLHPGELCAVQPVAVSAPCRPLDGKTTTCSLFHFTTRCSRTFQAVTPCPPQFGPQFGNHGSTFRDSNERIAEVADLQAQKRCVSSLQICYF